MRTKPWLDNFSTGEAEKRALMEVMDSGFPLRYLQEHAGLQRERVVEAINAEGIKFHQGYVRPLYLQPVF